MINNKHSFNLSFRLSSKELAIYSSLLIAGTAAAIIFSVSSLKKEQKREYIIVADSISEIANRYYQFGSSILEVKDSEDEVIYRYSDYDGNTYSIGLSKDIELPTGYIPPSPVHAFILSFEHFEPVAYWDYKQWTNGYGTKAKNKDEVITTDEAITRFEERVDDAFNIASKHSSTWGQMYALVDLTYNAGNSWINGAITSNPIDLNLTRKVMNKYVYVTVNGKKKKLKGLVNRRRKATELFLGEKR